jgi:alanyl-tRNA synthetase
MPGEFAFELYDTYGLPLDLTQAVCRDYHVTVDVEGFERLMAQQRQRSRAARTEEALAPELKLSGAVASRFVGYDHYHGESEVLASHIGDEGKAEVVVAETPFYPEGGGQVGDRGTIRVASGALLEITETRKVDGAIIHLGHLLQGDAGQVRPGARVTLEVDRARRDAAMLNHSATHILHYALRDVLGSHVHQAGSLVAPDRLRFDFAHTSSIAPRDLQTIEEEVNARIRENAAVVHEEMAHADALKTGALAFFGEKYGDRVRVVRMGDFSIELCGGTHVARTGDIGVFKLEAESGVAAGVRRVEALTGQGALEAIRRREEILREIGDQLRAKDGAALERLQRLLAREKELEKKISSLERKLAAGESAPADETVRDVGGIKLITRRLEGVEPGAMRGIADQIRSQHKSAVVALGSAVSADKVALLVAVTPDLVPKVKAGEIIKQIAPIVGGSGGGRPDFAQAGGRDPARLNEALDKVSSLLGGG